MAGNGNAPRISHDARDMALPDRFVIQCGFLIRAFYFDDDGAQSVIAGADGDAFFGDPVAVIELFRSVRESKDVLVDGFPCFIAEAVRLGVVGIEDLSFFHHGAFGESGGGVFFCQFFVERGSEDCDFAAFHDCRVCSMGATACQCGGEAVSLSIRWSRVLSTAWKDKV